MNVCPEQIGGRIEKYYQSTEKINENVYTGARLARLILSPNLNHHFPIIQRLSLLCSGCSIVLVVAIETHRYVQAEALCVSSDTT